MSVVNKRIALATPAPVTHRTAEENLGLGYLAAYLDQHDYQTKIFDAWLENLDTKNLVAHIIGYNPAIVGFSSYMTNINQALSAVTLLRENGYSGYLVAGGYGPTFNPERFLDAGFDVAVIGEGEETLLEIAHKITEGNKDISDISGIAFKKVDGSLQKNISRRGIENLDKIPFPKRESLKLAKARKSAISISTSRGCLANCVFCSVVSFARKNKGPQWRQRSTENFVDELQSLADNYNIRTVKIVDDSFMEPPRDVKWAKELADLIQERNLDMRLRGQIRADRVDNEIIYQLKRAGFFSFACGIESFSSTALKRMNKTASVQANKDCLDAFKENGMHMVSGLILFDHETTMDELWENYDGIKSYNWTTTKGIFTEMYAADGTPFTTLLDKKGILNKRDALNNQYPTPDGPVGVVYKGLKYWHTKNMHIYDKVIDVLTAPKDVSENDFESYHKLATEMKGYDLNFMYALLNVADTCDLKSVNDFVDDQLMLRQESYSLVNQRVDALNTSCGINYDAKLNPFIR